MKNVIRQWHLFLALASALAAPACGGTDDPAADNGAAAPPPAVEAHKQELFTIPFNCFVTATTVVIGPGPGHPISFCKFDMNCVHVDANGNFYVTKESTFGVCPSGT
jgi:hypothetical protein